MIKHKKTKQQKIWQLFPVMFLLFIVFNSPSSYSQGNNYTFENFFIKEGFPVTRVLSINQDKEGLIWLCSESQIYSFDGSQFKLEIEFNKANFFPYRILFDNNGNKWLIEIIKPSANPKYARVNNVKIFNENNEELDLKKYLNLDKEKILRVYQNENGIISFKSEDGFYYFNQETKRHRLPINTKEFIYSTDEITFINTNTKGLLIDKETLEVLERFDQKMLRIKSHENDFYIQFENEKFYKYNQNSKALELISENALAFNNEYNEYLFDDSGDLWIVKQRRVSRYDFNENKEINFRTDINNKAIPFITATYKDREGNLWFGTNLGLNKITVHKNAIFKNSGSFDKSTRTIVQLNENELFVSSYEGDFIYNIESNIATKTSDRDVILAAIKENEYYYTINTHNLLRKETLKPNKVIKEKKFSYIQFAGRYPGSLIRLSNGKKYLLLNHSIYEFDENLNHTMIYEDTSKKLFFHNAYEINKKIYTLSNKGIWVYDIDFKNKEELIGGYSIKLLHQDKVDEHILWLSTTYELIKYNTKTKKTEIYDASHGFLNTNFTAINEDSNGNLWLPSYTGINKFNKKTEKNQVYLIEEGISNNEFNNYSHTVLNDGRLVFGSISGLTFIDTDYRKNDNISIPEINIKSCTKLNSNKDERLDCTIKLKENSKLIFNERDIEANILLSHYSFKELKTKQFMYRIFEKDSSPENQPWSQLLANEIVLGRMPYGTYTLQFKAQSGYGNSVSNINEIEVEYAIPLYKTLVVQILGALLFLFALFYFINRRSLSLVKQKLALETEVQERTQQIQKQKQELENLNNTKDKLFSIIAHDLKSPLITLTNISGKINYLIKKKQPERIIEIGKTIEDKVSHLTTFLDNLLNWSIQQRGHFNYKPVELSIETITKEILNLYDDSIIEKKLKIEKKIPADSFCFADENSVKTVIRNIIHNAIKYSPISGSICIEFKKGIDHNILAISDIGSGIPQSIINAIYRKEYIKNTPGTVGETGTGLGFLIAKELMDLNNGKMVFITNPGKGTTVELMLPVSEQTQSI